MVEYDSKTKEGKCIFCEIAAGRIAPLGNGKIWENEKYVAWLSPFPNTEGFTVLIPKKHYPSDVLAMPDSELGELMLEAKKVAKVLENAFADVGRVGLILEGIGIDHAHVKLFPMHGTEHLKRGEWRQYHSNKPVFFEKYEGYLMSNDGPKTDFEKLAALAEKIRKSIK